MSDDRAKYLLIDGHVAPIKGVRDGEFLKYSKGHVVGGSGGGAEWGGITGTLSSQTDLQGALDGKQAAGDYASSTHDHDYAASSHGHAIGDVTGLQAALDGKQASGSYAASDHDHDADYAALGHTHEGGDISGAWPVGSVFLSVVSTNPGTLLGFGTWVAFGAGRMLVGVNSGDSDFDAAEKTGGSKTSTAVVNHTHSVTVTDNGHNHTQNAHTHVQDAHSHTIPVGATDDTSAPFDRADAGTNASGANASTATGTATATNQSTTATNNSATTGITAATQNPAGGVASFSLMNPFIAVYMWKRTA